MIVEDLVYQVEQHAASETSQKSRKIYDDALDDIIDIYGEDSPEASLARTNLEEYLFWSNTDLARSDGYEKTNNY